MIQGNLSQPSNFLIQCVLEVPHVLRAGPKRVLEYGIRAPVFHGNVREQTGENGFPPEPTGNMFCIITIIIIIIASIIIITALLLVFLLSLLLLLLLHY